MALSAVGECAELNQAPQENARNETKRCRKRRVVKFGALGDGGQ